MGNSLGHKKKTTTIMKITGETIKIKTPVTAGEAVKDHPGLVLIDAEMVEHYGIRAKPLEPHEELKAKRLYFMLELPKLVDDRGARRVRSGINMGAKERLESLKLARRSASDLSVMKTPRIVADNGGGDRRGGGGGDDAFRVKLRLPKVEVERMMKESKDEKEVAEKIMKLCMESGGGRGGGGGVTTEERRVEWKSGGGRDGLNKGRGKRVGFSEELNHTWM